MNEEALKWEILNRRTILHTPIYDVLSQTERAADGLEGEYVAIQAPDWVMTIPVWQAGDEIIQTTQEDYYNSSNPQYNDVVEVVKENGKVIILTR